ncbi:MAG: hypothetical protein ACNS61_06360 [Candidatus Wenzhouxiangella sp. M2_3B_020]
MNSNSRMWLAAVAATVLVACGGESRPPEEAVPERAQARWDAIVEGDYETAWSYYTPGYRERVSAGEFAADMGGRPFEYQGAEIGPVDCTQERCELRVAVSFEIPAAPNQLSGFQSRQGVDEIWLFIDGQWWYSP